MGTDIDPTEQNGRNIEVNQNLEQSKSSESIATSQDSSETVKTSKFAAFAPKTLFAKLRNMNTSAKLACILAAVLVIVGITAFSLTRNDATSQEQANIQEVEEVETIDADVSLQEGTLEIKDNEEWIVVTDTTEIKSGAVLRTVGATSRSVVTFEGGSELRLDANSEAELQTLTATRIVIKHVSGYTFSRVVPSQVQTYVVTSEDAQYEAMGTAFKTAATGDEQAVEVYQSSVIETGINKTAKEGEKLIVKNEADPSKDGKIEKLDIEQVKTDAFLQWNRELDLKNENFKSSLGFLGDVEAPELKIDTADGETVLLETSATEGTIEFTGTTEKGAKVTVQSKSQNGSTAVEAVVDANGGFKTPVISAPVGNASFEFIAKDKSGNKTTKTIRITFQRKSQANTSGLTLAGEINTDDKKVELGWATSGDTTTPDGVKILYSLKENPVFESDKKDLVETGNTWSEDIKNFESGKTYYFKVCTYDKASNTCGLYSNQVKLDIP